VAGDAARDEEGGPVPGRSRDAHHALTPTGTNDTGDEDYGITTNTAARAQPPNHPLAGHGGPARAVTPFHDLALWQARPS